MRRTIVTLAVFFLVSGIAAAGAAELSLDRATVQDLLRAAIPRTLEIDIRGLGKVALELGPAQQTAFVDGGVETIVPVRLPVIGLDTKIALRFEPEIEPLYGTPLLRVEEARVERLDLDLAELLPAVALPRGGEWSFPLDANGQRELALEYFVQGIAVEAERLRIALGVRVEEKGDRPLFPTSSPMRRRS